jgi:hypothetical protein
MGEVGDSLATNLVGNDRHRLRLEGKTLLRFEPGRGEIELGIERGLAPTVEAPSVTLSPFAGCRQIRPTRMMGAINQAVEANGKVIELGRHRDPSGVGNGSGIAPISNPRQVILDRLGAPLLEQILGGLVTKGWQWLRAKPGKSACRRARPRDRAIDDVDGIAETLLRLRRVAPRSFAERIAREPGGPRELDFGDMQLLGEPIGLDETSVREETGQVFDCHSHRCLTQCTNHCADYAASTAFCKMRYLKPFPSATRSELGSQPKVLWHQVFPR